MTVLILAHMEMVLIKDPVVMAVVERLAVCYLLCLDSVLFRIYSVLILQ